MFVHKLRMSVAAQQETKVIEPSDYTLEFYPVNKENGHGSFLLSDMV